MSYYAPDELRFHCILSVLPRRDYLDSFKLYRRMPSLASAGLRLNFNKHIQSHHRFQLLSLFSTEPPLHLPQIRVVLCCVYIHDGRVMTTADLTRGHDWCVRNLGSLPALYAFNRV